MVQFNILVRGFLQTITHTRLTIRDTRRIKSIDFAVIAIQYLSSSGEMIVVDPMVQIGNIATDWHPTPEDVQDAALKTIANLESRIIALETANNSRTFGD